MKTTHMNKRTAVAIGDDAEIALKTVAEGFGLILKRENGKYTDDTYTVKFTFKVETEEGIPAEFIRLAPKYGLSASDYGKKFSTNSGTFVITGINARRPKYPISGKCFYTGKSFKFTLSAVKAKV